MAMRRTLLPRRLPRCPFAAPLAFAVVAAGACGRAPSAGEAELREGDRVRFVAPGYSARTLIGMIGRAGQCISVMVPDQLPVPRRFDVVPVDSLTVLEVDRSDGGQAPDLPRLLQRAVPGTPGGRGWIPVSVAAVKRRYGACRPGES